MGEKDQPKPSKLVPVQKSIDPTSLVPNPIPPQKDGSEGSEQTAPSKPPEGSDKKKE